MSDLAYTPTRQMAQSAAQKASEAYATARQALSRMDAIEETLSRTRAEVTDLQNRLSTCLRRIAELESEKAALVARAGIAAPPERKRKVA